MARLVALAAWAWFTLAISWGAFGSIGSGHYAAAAGIGIIAENMLRWGTGGMVWSYFHAPPAFSDYVCHHPLGTAWLAAISVHLFGHRDWALVMPAVAMSSATVALTWSIARHRLGHVPAAATACAWAVTPIALSFGNFLSLETMVMFGLALFFWGQDRMLATSRRRFLLASIAGVFVATTGDWPGYIGVGTMLAWGLLRGFLLPRRLTERVPARYATWWALCATTAVVTLLFIVGSFLHAGKLGDWLAAGELRGGDGAPLAQALAARHTWIEAMFTPVAITLGKLALPVCLFALLVRRRDADVYPHVAWTTAAFQYVVFKKGADVHIFWPHYFALYYALALAQLAAAAQWMVQWLVLGCSERWSVAVGRAAGVTVVLVPTVVMAPDAARLLRWARQSGGRFNNNATGYNRITPFRTEGDALFVVRWMREQLGGKVADVTIDVSPSQAWGWEHAWALGGPSRWADVPALPTGPANADRPYFIARGSRLGVDAMKRLAGAGHVRAFGDVWVIDEREAAAPVDAYSLDEQAPGLLGTYFVWGAEPARSITVPDPWLTWELRDHLGIAAPVTTPSEPATLEDTRAAYNLAIARGDAARAELLRERIEGQLERSVAARYEDGTRLIGVRVSTGSQPTLEAWLEAAGPMDDDAYFGAHSQVVARAPFSSIPIDEIPRDLSFPPPIPTRLWKRGYIYHHDAVMLHRVGLERFAGAWVGGGPKRVDRTDEQSVDLVTSF